MNFRALSWPQAAIFIVCILASVAAAKWGGPNAAMITGSVGTVIAWLLKSPHDPQDPPAKGGSASNGAGSSSALLSVLTIVVLMGLVGACNAALTPAERSALETFSAKLLVCQEAGREAGTYKAYEACKKDAGL